MLIDRSIRITSIADCDHLRNQPEMRRVQVPRMKIIPGFILRDVVNAERDDVYDAINNQTGVSS
jgi:hypothetical protein